MPSLPQPWRDFLAKVDGLLKEPIELHCLGGFVVEVVHGGSRATGDLDYVEVIPSDATAKLETMAGRDSRLARKYGIHLQRVGVADVPESYAERLIELFAGHFKNLKLFGLEPHDLALSKLSRNLPIDRRDVEFLARTVPLDGSVIKARYFEELRPIMMGDRDWHDKTLAMWLEAYFSPNT